MHRRDDRDCKLRCRRDSVREGEKVGQGLGECKWPNEEVRRAGQSIRAQTARNLRVEGRADFIYL
jgi:hypothetical protein